MKKFLRAAFMSFLANFFPAIAIKCIMIVCLTHFEGVLLPPQTQAVETSTNLLEDRPNTYLDEKSDREPISERVTRSC